MSKEFQTGERIQISADYHWAQSARGTIGTMPPRKVESLEGELTFYWVTFDHPQYDVEEDGPYPMAEIDSRYIESIPE